MTIRECYGELGLDFDAVLSRLVNEKLVQKFALKFLYKFSESERCFRFKRCRDRFPCGTYLKRCLPESWI